MARRMSYHVKQLHKKFIPANIIYAIVALIAGICVLVMPWFDFRIHVEGSQVAKLITDTMESNTSEGEEDVVMDTVVKELSKSLKEVDLDIPINMYPLKMLEFARVQGTLEEREQKLAIFADSMISSGGASAFLEKFVNTLTPALLKATTSVAIDVAITEAIKESGVDLTEEQQQAIEQYKGEANTIIDTLVGTEGQAPDTEKAKEEFTALVEKIATEQGGEDVEIPQEEINKVFDDMVEQGTNPETGEFDLTYLLSNFDMNSFDFSTGGQSLPEGFPEGLPEGDGTPTAFAKTVADDSMDSSDSTDSGDSSDSSSEGGEGSSDGENSDAALKEVMELLKDPNKLILELLSESEMTLKDMQNVQLVFLIAFLVVAGVPAALYFLFVLSCMLRLFTKKKKVRTWYIKIHGFFSMLFILLPNILASNVGRITKLLGEGTATTALNAFKIQFLGSGVVTAICYGILVLFGWFYYNRVKKEIKEAIKAEKDAAARGGNPIYGDDVEARAPIYSSSYLDNNKYSESYDDYEEEEESYDEDEEEDEE